MSSQSDIGTLTPAQIHWPPPPHSKWQREFLAFRRLLPQLLSTLRGQYVAVHEERVIDQDCDEMALIARVLAQVGNVDIHVGLVTEQLEPIHRSGVIRGLTAREAS